MPPMIYGVEIRRTAGVSQRLHGRAANHALRRAGEQHLALHLPRHFEENAATRPGGAYGYSRRSRRWQKRKQRLVGHQIPNVFTGRTRIAVLGSARVTATQTRMRILLRGAFPMRREQWSELKAIAPGELRRLRQLAHRNYLEFVQANREKTTKRVA